jgi:hypothetical protein
MKITTKWLKRRIDIARTESYASGREAGIRLGIEEGKKQERESQAGRILEARTRLLDAIARYRRSGTWSDVFRPQSLATRNGSLEQEDYVNDHESSYSV